MGKPVNKTLRIAAMSAGEEIGHVSGPIVTFRGNGAPLRSLLVNIEPVQAGSGDPSPDNVRPISGWSAVKVWRTGKNLLDIPDQTISSAQYIYNDSVHFKSGNYVFSVSKSGGVTQGNVSIAAVMENGNNATVFPQVSGDRLTLTIAASVDIVEFRVYAVAGEYTKFQLELGSTATPYAPYSGSQYTLALGQTVYGGTLDVTNGVLTVTHGFAVFNGTEAWNEYSAYNGYFVIIPDMKKGTRQNGLSNMLKLNAATNGMWLGVDNQYFFVLGVHDSMGTTMTDFKNYLLAHNLEVLYPLATPITIPLTPTEISTLQGQNNLWADSGDVDVEYIATGGEGGKLALLLRNRKELLIALRKGLSPAEAGLLGSIPSFGGSLSPGVIRPGLNTQEEEEDEKDDA